jgi:leucyl aminopeptidase
MLKFSAVSLQKTAVSTLAIPVCEDTAIHDDPQVQSLIEGALQLKEFSGEKGQQVTLYQPAGTRIQRCLFIGVGPQKKLNAEILRAFAGKAVQICLSIKEKQLLIAVPLSDKLEMDARASSKSIMEGAFLANHVLNHYKEKKERQALDQILVRVPEQVIKRQRSLTAEVEAIGGAALQARDWVNLPANDKTPEQLAKRIAAVAEKARLTVKILDQTQLKRKKFGALLAVGAGSAHAPRLVEIIYRPKTAKKTIVLVGKGVTFDTGGINIKPSSGLETMKADMAGAAAVAAAMLAAVRLKPKHRLVGIMPLVENMPSGSATRPGDIVTTFSGKTVEIGNTDAEGRLILADSMAYAVKQYKPDILIDMATLTGACLVALGEKMAAVFSKDDALADVIVKAGQTVHERCWRMPLPEDYMELLKSDMADIGNMPSSRYGGAITAALFLSEFVGETRWAHIDIAGPAYLKKGSDYCNPGATGFGVRLLWELIGSL